jgi:hypothetical protein
MEDYIELNQKDFQGRESEILFAVIEHVRKIKNGVDQMSIFVEGQKYGEFFEMYCPPHNKKHLSPTELLVLKAFENGFDEFGIYQCDKNTFVIKPWKNKTRVIIVHSTYNKQLK